MAAESILADVVRAVNNLATAQVRKDTPSLIDVKGLGRPKEFTGREEDFQQWSKKTEAFLAGVTKGSEMMLEWAAEQPTRRMRTRTEELKTWSSFCSRFTQHSWLSRVLKRMTLVAYSRKNPLEAWRRLQKRYDPTAGGRKRNLLRTITSPGLMLSAGTSSGYRRLGVLRVSLREEDEA